MNKYARVKDLLKAYEKAYLPGVILYVEDKDLIIDDDTWIKKIKDLLANHNYQSAEAEIASILHSFKLL